ncbi:MAG: hypothetical protein V2J20_01135 [Wenzhouxiangella sp.]|nr:hypothetical protein [Wenzhouxiangella sp.]
MRLAALLLGLAMAGNVSATGEINVLTDLYSPFPPGCVGLELPNAPSSNDNVMWDTIERAPGIGSSSANSDVRVQIWRVGCADDGYSVVMVRLTNQSENEVLIPQIFVDTETKDGLLWHDAQLITNPAVGNISAAGSIMPATGRTFMLGVEPLSLFDNETIFTPSDYNDEFLLELFWGAYSPGVQNPQLFPIFPYEPALDPPQFALPLLHGRMSGSYTVPGKAATGLFLNVAELADDTNFIFAVFFTYLNGAPVWVVGNTPGIEPGADLVEIDMQLIEGGRFFTDPGSFTDADTNRETIGTMQIEVLDCNTLLLDYDFASSGLGVGSLTVDRLARIAGYDCNPWQ